MRDPACLWAQVDKWLLVKKLWFTSSERWSHLSINRCLSLCWSKSWFCSSVVSFPRMKDTIIDNSCLESVILTNLQRCEVLVKIPTSDLQSQQSRFYNWYYVKSKKQNSCIKHQILLCTSTITTQNVQSINFSLTLSKIWNLHVYHHPHPHPSCSDWQYEGHKHTLCLLS